ncbi:ferritin-like domain-containing protein [Ruania zhangjianzhongii]|uniref:ferritin-like domain-containing protein n=1 Tax=Ruania zhangjianzhongii TaxID=2603206 RepID=UPI0011CCCD74|nr:ferritin-like domain-containing protein [Ruania zhangjianzhongii]
MAFDIERFARDSVRVGWDDLDLEVFRTDPLPPESLRTLRYMCDVEYHTVCYLRDMLVTRSRRETEVNAFMTMWNREEFWHGEALAHVLSLHDITVSYDELKAKRVKLGWKDRLAPLKQSIMSNLVGKDFVAVHMIWGAVNEWTAAAAYKRLAVLEGHPGLAELLRRIAAQEARHVAFYATQARNRLTNSPKAQKLARLALSTAWRPVGSGIASDDEVTHVMGHLFGGAAGRKAINAVDRHIAKLPGMEGLAVVADAFDARGIAAA